MIVKEGSCPSRRETHGEVAHSVTGIGTEGRGCTDLGCVSRNLAEMTAEVMFKG